MGLAPSLVGCEAIPCAVAVCMLEDGIGFPYSCPHCWEEGTQGWCWPASAWGCVPRANRLEGGFQMVLDSAGVIVVE